ncbi:MAG: prephenate dehydrogenase [Oscillospiraceae bacterium]|nr:prephenate dehydrogenase [Oscillospiraceae bacterium]
MKVGVVGLGLIGGSFVKAYHAAGHEVYGWNRSRSTLDYAMLSGDIDGELTPDVMRDCDLILVTLYAPATIDWIRANADHFGQKPFVIDCCGTKRTVCQACFPIAAEHGFMYVGGHPMAGTHFSGYKYSKATMYNGAPMVIVPPVYDDIMLLEKIKQLLSPAGFGRYSITSAEEHDRMIAFTSQMAHVVSNAFIKSPTASSHKGFSAGSYKDLTRVAWLNAPMWADLFLENKDYLCSELDIYINNLIKYRDAMIADDREELTRLLEEGKRRKEEVDGR